MIKVAISGCCGKMGAMILKLALKDNNLKVVSILEKAGHPSVGSDVSGLKVSDAAHDIKNADVLIEFTSPESTIEHLDVCLKYRKAMAIGTTGLSEEYVEKIKSASKKIPIVFSPNMSVGVNLLFKLVREASQKLSAEYKTSITEAHHVHKKDSPSGTAKKIAQIVREERGENIADAITSIRKDEIVGDHEVVFEGPFDMIRLAHSAKARDIFAQGALVAAQWVVGKKSGLYSMEDIIR